MDGMKLGACTQFGQGAPLKAIGQIVDGLGLRAIRDEVHWNAIERTRGVYDLDHPRLRYLDVAAAAGVEVTLLVNWGNSLYDGGDIPYTDNGRRAMGAFAAALVRRFPAIAAVEVGNEWTGDDFLNGPILAGRYADRPRAIVPLTRAVRGAVKRARPEVTVVGGAAHSVPLGWFDLLLEAGLEEACDALAIHPYTLADAQVPGAIALLKARAPGLAIFATEFGHERATGDSLERTVAALAAAGVDTAHWFLARYQGTPDHDWWNGMHLLEIDGTLTDAGRRVAARDFSRPARLARPGIVAFEGGGEVALTDRPHALVDTLRDFDPENPADGAVVYYELQPDGGRMRYRLMPGAQADGNGNRIPEPWNPYVGDPWRRPVAIDGNRCAAHYGRTIVQSIAASSVPHAMPDGAVLRDGRIELFYPATAVHDCRVVIERAADDPG